MWVAATCAGSLGHRCPPCSPPLPSSARPQPPCATLLCTLATADELTGFEHNGVSPIALKTRLPIVMSHKWVLPASVAQLN